MVSLCLILGSLISVFFDNPKSAAVVGNLAFTIAIYTGHYAKNLSQTKKQLFCLIGPSCFMASVENLVM